VRKKAAVKGLRLFSYKFCGGIFTRFRETPYFLVKPGEPIPLPLLRKTRVVYGRKRPKNHPITGQPINYGQVPFGYKAVNGTLQEDPMEQFVLRQIRAMRQNGSSLNAICRYLIDSGIPTKNGGRWQSNTVNQILSRGV
jgi:hypothetical protein